MQEKSVFQEKCVRCHQSTAPYTTSPPEAQSPEHRVSYEPQTSPRRRRSFPKGEGAAHTEFTKTATKNEVPSLPSPTALLPPSPLQRDQTERAATGSIHRHPAQSSAPRVMAATRSARSNYGPEIANCFYKIVRRKKKKILFPPCSM